MDCIRNTYGDTDSSDEETQETQETHLVPLPQDKKWKDCAPPEAFDKRVVQTVAPEAKVLCDDSTCEEHFHPDVGPENQFKSNFSTTLKNTSAGFVETCHANSFDLENQRKTFDSNGSASNPSVTGNKSENQMTRVIDTAVKHEEATFIEAVSKKREGTDGPMSERKRFKNNDQSDIEGYTGSRENYKDEITLSVPSEENKKYLGEYFAERKKRNVKIMDEKPIDESSTLHLMEPVDYQGRSFMREPKDVGVELQNTETPEKCHPPKGLIHTWIAHNKRIHAIRWFPVTAHLILSCSMDTKVKLWQFYGNRSLVRTYSGHTEAVRDICFNNSGTEFLSCSNDRYIKLWDTEKGECKGRFTNNTVPHCVKFYPEDDNLFVAGTKDKKIICWDIRANKIVQDYNRHLGPVNTVTFVDQDRRFVTTSDDRSLRLWDWGIPVDIESKSDPSVPARSSATIAPNGKWLACQGMDNIITIYDVLGKCKKEKKTFKGHSVTGFACGIDFSPEMSYLISGDGQGKLCIWDWRTTKLISRFKAHEKVTSACLWHPHEKSTIVTAGWDGAMRMWD